MPAATHHALAQRMRLLPRPVLDLVGAALLGRPLDPDAPYGDLVSAGWLAVDALLVLSRQPGGDYRDAMSLILGHPVSVGEPCLSRAHEPPNARLAAAPPGPDDRVLVAVAPNPRLPTTGAWSRYRHLRVGRTVGEAVRRGVTRRDLREALAAGWVELSAPRTSAHQTILTETMP